MDKNIHWFKGTDELLQDEKINDKQKLILMKLEALKNEKGYAFCSNQYLSDLFKIHKVNISKHLSKLEKVGYIKFEYDDKRNRRIIVNDLPNFNQQTISENANNLLIETLTPISENANNLLIETLTPISENANHNNKDNNKVNNKDNKRNKKEKNDIDEKVEILRNIFKEYYTNISERFITSKVKLQIKNNLKDFNEIEKGLKNYLEIKKKSKTDLVYIKSIHYFISDKMYKDYLELEEAQPTFKRKEEQIISVDDYLNGNY